MEISDEQILHYRHLQRLLEEDLQQIRQGIQGEILTAYEDTVKQELAALENMMRLIQYN